MIGEATIAFYVVVALVTVYIVAATWRSRDVRDRVSVKGRRSKFSAAPTYRPLVAGAPAFRKVTLKT